MGPIYSTGKIADERVHNFTQGYQAPLSAEQKAEKLRLIKKHFEKQQKAIGSLHEKVVSKVSSLQQQTEVRSHSESRVSREEALRLGENRRQEAVQRRQQFLQQERESRRTMSQREKMASQQERFLVQQEEQRMEELGGQRQVCQAWQHSSSQQQSWSETQQQTIQRQQQQISKTQQQSHTQSQQMGSEVDNGRESTERSALEEAARILTATVKSRQQLEAERDAMVSQTVQRYQLEASIMAERQQAEEKQRLEALEQERQRQAREEMERAERTKKLEEERLQWVKDEQEKIRTTQAERKRMEDQARERAKIKAEEKQRQEEMHTGEKRKREEAQRRQEEEDARRQKKQEEETRIAQKCEQEELWKHQVETVARSGLRSPQVTRRADDLHGLGFGQVVEILLHKIKVSTRKDITFIFPLLNKTYIIQVKTGSVMSRKISLLTRAGSLEPEIDFTTESPAPKRRTVRFAGLGSPSPTMPTSRRPKVSLLKYDLLINISRWRQVGLQPRFNDGLRLQGGQAWWRKWTGIYNNKLQQIKLKIKNGVHRTLGRYDIMFDYV